MGLRYSNVLTAALRQRVRPGPIRRIFGHFGPHLRRYRSTLFAALLCMIGATAMELLRPWPLKLIFDGILMPTAGAGELLAHVPSLADDPQRLLLAIALAVLVIAIAGGLFRYAQAYLTSSVGQKVIAAIRLQLYGHIQRLSQSFHDTRSSGDLMTRLTGDINLMRDLMVNAFIQLSESLLVIVGMLAVMLWMDWQLTLVALAVLPALMLATGKFSRELKGATRTQRKREGKIANILAESISTVKVIQAFGRESHEERRFSRQNGSTMRAGIAATRLEYRLNLVVQAIVGAGTAAVFWFGVQRVQSGVLSPGDLLVFAAYLTALYKPVRKLAAFSGRIAKATACGERVVDTLDIEPDIQDAPDAVPAPVFRGEIVFDRVTFGYRCGEIVLHDLSLRVAVGEKVALVGHSGSGKSTVINLLLRFYDPTMGSVRIDGQDIRRYSLTSLRQQIAVVLQDSVLFNATLRDNIAYGRLDATQEEVELAARAANIHDFIENLPDGYDTLVGERGAMLSGGQRQRIAIARAMIQDARMIILDEPMTGLDRDSEAKVQQAMKRLTRGKTCLLITHDRRAANAADRTLCIRHGRIMSDVGSSEMEATAQ